MASGSSHSPYAEDDDGYLPDPAQTHRRYIIDNDATFGYEPGRQQFRRRQFPDYQTDAGKVASTTGSRTESPISQRAPRRTTSDHSIVRGTALDQSMVRRTILVPEQSSGVRSFSNQFVQGFFLGILLTTLIFCFKYIYSFLLLIIFALSGFFALCWQLLARSDISAAIQSIVGIVTLIGIIIGVFKFISRMKEKQRS